MVSRILFFSGIGFGARVERIVDDDNDEVFAKRSGAENISQPFFAFILDLATVPASTDTNDK
jgi:hypothetical protein